MEATNIIDKIKITKKLLGKSNITEGNKYLIKISYNGKNCYMIYNDNYKNDSTKKDILFAFVSDARVFADYGDNLDYFASCFGYNDYNEARQVYFGCKRQLKKYNRLFDFMEQEELEDLLQDY